MKQIPSAMRFAIWLKYNGRVFDATCHCCMEERISVMNFHCGHVVSKRDGGPASLANLRPVCAACNTSMGPINMEAFIKLLHRIKMEGDTPGHAPTDAPQTSHPLIPIPGSLRAQCETEQQMKINKLCLHRNAHHYCSAPHKDESRFGFCKKHEK